MVHAGPKADGGGVYEPLLPGGDVESGGSGAARAAAAAGAQGGAAPLHGGHVQRRPLSLLPLIALIFFEVSGGPFGTEVRQGRAGGARKGHRRPNHGPHCEAPAAALRRPLSPPLPAPFLSPTAQHASLQPVSATPSCPPELPTHLGRRRRRGPAARDPRLHRLPARLVRP
jgi:hypothetical protein